MSEQAFDASQTGDGNTQINAPNNQGSIIGTQINTTYVTQARIQELDILLRRSSEGLKASYSKLRLTEKSIEASQTEIGGDAFLRKVAPILAILVLAALMTSIHILVGIVALGIGFWFYLTQWKAKNAIAQNPERERLLADKQAIQANILRHENEVQQYEAELSLLKKEGVSQ